MLAGLSLGTMCQQIPVAAAQQHYKTSGAKYEMNFVSCEGPSQKSLPEALENGIIIGSNSLLNADGPSRNHL